MRLTGQDFGIAVVGATGAVGQEMLRLLAQHQVAPGRIAALTSARSRGQPVPYAHGPLTAQEAEAFDFKRVRVALFSAGASVSKALAPRAVAAGAIVVDNSSAFRMQADVPLVVPEVNPQALRGHQGLIANPNCSTIQLVLPLCALQRRWGLRQVIVATYQAVSGMGRSGLEELARQTREAQEGRPLTTKALPHPILGNCVPQVDVFLDDGRTREEWKMDAETRKILAEPDLPVSALCVRVPVERAHSEAVWVSTKGAPTAQEARAAFAAFPGIRVIDDPAARQYPLARVATGQGDVLVGSIRQDPALPGGLCFWVVADQLLKGAALNAVQIVLALPD